MKAGGDEEFPRKEVAKTKELQREGSLTRVDQQKKSKQEGSKDVGATQEESEREGNEEEAPFEEESQEKKLKENVPEQMEPIEEETEEEEEIRELHEVALAGEDESTHSVAHKPPTSKPGDSTRQLDPVFCSSPTMEDQPNVSALGEQMNASGDMQSHEILEPATTSSQKEGGEDETPSAIKEKVRKEIETKEKHSNSQSPRQSKKKQKAFWKRTRWV